MLPGDNEEFDLVICFARRLDTWTRTVKSMTPVVIQGKDMINA